MTNRGVTVNAQAVTWLVAHALNSLPQPDEFQIIRTHGDDKEPGCCTRCCGPCGALKLLLDAGQLDDLIRDYAPGSSWWDEANGQVDRAWLAQVWDPKWCGNHDET